jgi:hypothetical protein
MSLVLLDIPVCGSIVLDELVVGWALLSDEGYNGRLFLCKTMMVGSLNVKL